ncbi:MAG: hypothetical protein ACN6PB_12790, partial [Achromobacter kerstersii]|uniref:hypothetical protein n=1 Tax=Achromobacter kerstersii TaxID=1353890 RepID=UPI003D063DE7
AAAPSAGLIIFASLVSSALPASRAPCLRCLPCLPRPQALASPYLSIKKSNFFLMGLNQNAFSPRSLKRARHP